MTVKKKSPFPNDIEYLKGIEKLKEIESTTGKSLNLISGNCGSFAVALKKVFGEGNLVALWGEGDILYKPGFNHVLLVIKDKLYDGVGIHTWEEEYKYFPETQPEQTITDEEYIEDTLSENTKRQNPPEFFINVLKNIFCEEK